MSIEGHLLVEKGLNSIESLTKISGQVGNMAVNCSGITLPDCLS